ncbi:hypothetical protein BS47DRAFT_1412254 [Hydnum rufescens UP504]|uniref:J domain-containing protein n=1 Tax=Hydnum rufescens UP504 TaxID=1448309 RepID=A0A9P6AP89_9AGAM|nr:hypothetical protein BS47DRAFT_1412254 [Hydnum rufescens UP504]
MPQEDHEIFDLVSALEAAEGKGTTFYSLLEVSPSASSAEIGKAYRKKSISMHPDKNRGVKDAEKRYARLGVIAKILRDIEGRERYDFFYKNGVPKWRGTGYYYERFRPGLITVLIFLIILTSGIQHIIQRHNRTRDLSRIERFIRLGKATAYGPKGLAIEGKRKVRVPSGGGPRGGGGRMVDLLVDANVFILCAGPGRDPVLLDESMAPYPLIKDTWAISLFLSAYSRVARTIGTGRPTTKSNIHGAPEVESSGNETSDNPANETSSRKPISQAGGQRRKGTTKRK